jgi:hypothetical protein
VVIGPEGVIGREVLLVLPSAGQLLLEPRERLVRPNPVAKQAGEAID